MVIDPAGLLKDLPRFLEGAYRLFSFPVVIAPVPGRDGGRRLVEVLGLNLAGRKLLLPAREEFVTMLPDHALHRIALGGADHEANTHEFIGIRPREVEFEEVFRIDEFRDVQGSPID